MIFSNTLSRCLTLCISLSLPGGAAENEWISRFNGNNLDGWPPKISGHPCGENALDTFQVDDGILKVSYDGCGKFDQQYGHLFTNISYLRYLQRMEYRFTGKMMPDAPSYVNLNSGVTIHSQSPQSMRLKQGFPVSMEFQFLADEGKGDRPTGNVCIPGTNLEINGKLVIHRVNGKEVLRYERPQLDPEGRVDDPAFRIHRPASRGAAGLVPEYRTEVAGEIMIKIAI